jgi:hypothetical protein
MAQVDDGIIMLDVRADRYSRLGSLASAVFVALAKEAPLSTDQASAARNLVAAGLLVNDGSGRRVQGVELALPTASALEHHTVDRGLRPGTIRCGSAVIEAVARLRFLGFDRTLQAARKWKIQRTTDAAAEKSIAYAQVFARRRTTIPLGRSCLPDSIALFGLATSAGIDATLVIGVRDRPFAAHCWVQTDDFILSDAVAPIREFTPIFAI